MGEGEDILMCGNMRKSQSLYAIQRAPLGRGNKEVRERHCVQEKGKKKKKTIMFFSVNYIIHDEYFLGI